MVEEIVVEDIRIKLSRKNIKNLRISVHPPEGEVRISVPNWVNDDAAIRFIKSKMEWIRNQRSRLKRSHMEEQKEYVTGEGHYYLGNEYILQVRSSSGRQGVLLEDGNIIMYVRDGNTREKRERLINGWYRDQLKELIPGYIMKWEPIIGVEVKDFGIKNMKTRWGTCNIRDGRIWINLKLATRNEGLLEYVLVHEMTHLLERLHNDRFKMLMTGFIPSWRELKRELNSQY